MKKLRLLYTTGIAALALSSMPAKAASVVVTAFSNGVGTSDGTSLPTSTPFSVGFFTVDGTTGGTLLTDAQIAALPSTAALDAAFVEFGVGNVDAGIPGIISSTVTAPSAGFTGQDMYTYFSFNSEVGVFKNTGDGTSETFPSESFGDDQRFFDFDPAKITASEIVIGSFGTGTSNNPFAGPVANFNLAPIPEPSAAALLLGSVGVIMLRRRRR